MKRALDYVQGDPTAELGHSSTSLLKSLADEAKKLGMTNEELLAKKTKFLKSCT
jgi:acetylornithine/succinyldiaminopimelate/putrescine aminotransferase